MIIKPIENFEGYFISDEGNVYCNLGKGNRRKGTTIPLYKIKPRETKNGCLRVYMRNSKINKRVDKYIHRLVAEAFLEKIPEKNFVNHKNCNRHDNRVCNIEWCNVKENNAQTGKLNHVYRNNKGQFVGNFNYRDCVLHSQEQ